jgi:hypothetical protein
MNDYIKNEDMNLISETLYLEYRRLNLLCGGYDPKSYYPRCLHATHASIDGVKGTVAHMHGIWCTVSSRLCKPKPH